MTIVVVSGVLANKPSNGGEAWVRLSWIRGLQRLGFQVYFIEEITRDTCVDESGRVTSFEDSVNLAWFRKWTEHFGLTDVSVLIYAGGERIHPIDADALVELAASTELLVNISGHLQYQPVMQRVRQSAYVDIDPGFTQIWHVDDAVNFRIADHDFYYTIGENIGRPQCPIPTGGLHWRGVRQPVVLDDWLVSSAGDTNRFTTVASWRGAFGRVEFGGNIYGVKAHEFRKVIALPQQAPGVFEIALDIHAGDTSDSTMLQQYGWKLIDPRQAIPDPIAFQGYVQNSGAEFSVAQGIYVDTGSGWFSDRTVRYLASGKPVVVQETGFRNHLPVGEGLVSFETLEDAVQAVRSVTWNYDAHAEAARCVAEAYFDSDRVLGQFVDEIGIAP